MGDPAREVHEGKFLTEYLQAHTLLHFSNLDSIHQHYFEAHYLSQSIQASQLAQEA